MADKKIPLPFLPPEKRPRWMKHYVDENGAILANMDVIGLRSSRFFRLQKVQPPFPIHRGGALYPYLNILIGVMRYPKEYLNYYVIPKRKKGYRIVFDPKNQETKMHFRNLHELLLVVYEYLPMAYTQYGGIPRPKPFNLITGVDLLLTYPKDGSRLTMKEWWHTIHDELKDRLPGEYEITYPKYAIRIDLKDYFHQNHFVRLRLQLAQLGMSETDAARQIAQAVLTNAEIEIEKPKITIGKGAALQGLPTSMIVTTLASYAANKEFEQLLDSWGVHGVWWVDDLIITIPPWFEEAKIKPLMDAVLNLLSKHHLRYHRGPRDRKRPRVKANPKGVMALLFSSKGAQTGFIRPSRRLRRFARLLKHIDESGEDIRTLSKAKLRGIREVYKAYVDAGNLDPEAMKLYKEAIAIIDKNVNKQR